MPDILGFNPNRPLEFDPRRGVDFNPNRPLEFDPRRSLEFQPNRDLGFGRRGVVFRGFVCPICGALTTETAVKCSECGANFEGSPSKMGSAPPQAEAVPVRPDLATPPITTPSPSPVRETVHASVPAAPSAAERRSKFCAFCAARLWENDAFCWNCGARLSGGAATAGLPHRRG